MDLRQCNFQLTINGATCRCESEDDINLFVNEPIKRRVHETPTRCKNFRSIQNERLFGLDDSLLFCFNFQLRMEDRGEKFCAITTESFIRVWQNREKFNLSMHISPHFNLSNLYRTHIYINRKVVSGFQFSSANICI